MKQPDRILTLADANELESLRAERDAVVRTAKEAVAKARARAFREAAKAAELERRNCMRTFRALGGESSYTLGYAYACRRFRCLFAQLAREVEREAAK
jgi:hypothetical protein